MSLPDLARSKAHANRQYVHPVTQQEYASVTTITGMKDKPALVNWAANATIDYTVTHWDYLSTILKKHRREEMKDSRYNVKFGKTSFSASNVGNLTHDMVEQYIYSGVPAFSDYGLSIIAKQDPPVSPDEAMDQILPWFASFKSWEDRFKPTKYYSEVTVFNHTVGYAGTLDLMFQLNDRWYLTDLKCGREVYPDTALQLTALAHGEEMVASDGTCIPMFDISSLSVLHLTAKHCEWVQFHDDPATWETFKALSVVQSWEVNRRHLQIGTKVRVPNALPEPSNQAPPVPVTTDSTPVESSKES